MMRTNRPRGITLTEILIAILLLGVGVTSIFTLFPLGVLRLRDAQRLSRSGLLVESAGADLGVRNLLAKNSFMNATSGPWYSIAGYTPWPYDPWVQDTPSYLGDPIVGPTFGAYRGNGSFNIYNKVNGVPTHNLPAPTGFIAGPGLPVAYDPLWRMSTPAPQPLGTQQPVGYWPGAPSEARFGSGLGSVRPDPNPGTSKTADASAHGLQRITNFPYFNVAPWVNVTTVNSIFVSPDDMVLQSESDSSKAIGSSSPIVPDLNLVPAATTYTGQPTIQNDWKYTWMFTGQQADATNGTVFVGDVVVFENRQFAVEPAPTYFKHNLASGGVAAGETVVEAVFGYTNNVTIPPGGSLGYGSNANRAVLLRWSAKMPDPEIRVGNWIADVTYERNANEDNQRTVVDPGTNGAGAFYPYQRCYWYQISKRTEANSAANKFTGDDTVNGMREMTVWVNSPLRALTLLSSTGEPYHVNVALVCPSVINVFPRSVHTR